MPVHTQPCNAALRLPDAQNLLFDQVLLELFEDERMNRLGFGIMIAQNEMHADATGAQLAKRVTRSLHMFWTLFCLGKIAQDENGMRGIVDRMKQRLPGTVRVAVENHALQLAGQLGETLVVA